MNFGKRTLRKTLWKKDNSKDTLEKGQFGIDAFEKGRFGKWTIWKSDTSEKEHSDKGHFGKLHLGKMWLQNSKSQLWITRIESFSYQCNRDYGIVILTNK